MVETSGEGYGEMEGHGTGTGRQKPRYRSAVCALIKRSRKLWITTLPEIKSDETEVTSKLEQE